jgi:hypothetical protein
LYKYSPTIEKFAACARPVVEKTKIANEIHERNRWDVPISWLLAKNPLINNL